MDAKTKANFINSVAEGGKTVCKGCGTTNTADSKFCTTCGTALSSAEESDTAPAFASIDEAADVKEEAVEAAAPEKAVTKKESPYVEPKSVFAQGLPEWNLEPPQVAVRRR